MAVPRRMNGSTTNKAEEVTCILSFIETVLAKRQNYDQTQEDFAAVAVYSRNVALASRDAYSS